MRSSEEDRKNGKTDDTPVSIGGRKTLFFFLMIVAFAILALVIIRFTVLR